MKSELLKWLCCPECKGEILLVSATEENSEIKEGQLVCQCGKRFPIENFIPRFVDSDKYLRSFSFEWKMHKNTQLDSANVNSRMRNISHRMFQEKISFDAKDLNGKLVLDAGCGMGRYAEIALDTGAVVLGFDLSQAVEMAFDNLRDRSGAYFIQADIFKLPFKPQIFDFIYSWGVLHHTPSAHNAFDCLVPLLKKGGKISIFIYSSYNKAICYMTDFWRFFTTRLPKRILYYLCFISVPLYFIYKIPIIGRIGKMIFTISMAPNWRWRILDTFDWYAPLYQSKHTHTEVFKWFEEAGFSDIKALSFEITLQGTKNGENLKCGSAALLAEDAQVLGGG